MRTKTDAATAPFVEGFPRVRYVRRRYIDRLRAVRQFHTGIERIRDAGGPVAMVHLGPAWLVPAYAAVSSPQGAHDVLESLDSGFPVALPFTTTAAGPIRVRVTRRSDELVAETIARQ